METQMLRIYMKSGNIIEVPAVDWHAEGNAEEITRLKWDVSDDRVDNPLMTKIVWVCLPEVEAITVQDL